VEKAAEDNFAEEKGEGEKVDVVVVEATKVKVVGNQKQVEVTKVVVYVFVVGLRGIKLHIARMRKNLRKRWKNAKTTTLREIKSSGISRLVLTKITVNTALCCLTLLLLRLNLRCLFSLLLLIPGAPRTQ
jgi:hypothetical protein